MDELRRLQPTAGCMRLLSDSILRVWRDRKSLAKRASVDDRQRGKCLDRRRRDVHGRPARLRDRFGHARRDRPRGSGRVAGALTWERYDAWLQRAAGDDSVLEAITADAGGPCFAMLTSDADSPFSGDGGTFRLALVLLGESTRSLELSERFLRAARHRRPHDFLLASRTDSGRLSGLRRCQPTPLSSARYCRLHDSRPHRLEA